MIERRRFFSLLFGAPLLAIPALPKITTNSGPYTVGHIFCACGNMMYVKAKPDAVGSCQNRECQYFGVEYKVPVTFMERA